MKYFERIKGYHRFFLYVGQRMTLNYNEDLRKHIYGLAKDRDWSPLRYINPRQRQQRYHHKGYHSLKMYDGMPVDWARYHFDNNTGQWDDDAR